MTDASTHPLTHAAAPSAGDATKLRAMVDAFPGPGYAIVDGGHFDDLPASFRRSRLFARSLFLDAADLDVQAAGPWLVALDQSPDATGTIFTLVGDKPAAVFWCCDAGETVLWRHLRTLNMARIPTWAANGGMAPPEDAGRDTHEALMFRHWDPSVLGSLLPILDAPQFARIVGPAQSIAFEASDYGGAKRVVANADWPAPAPGLLKIESHQIEQLNARRIAASHRRVSTYLRSVAPEDVGSASDGDLHRHVLVSDATGRQLGIVTEAGHCRWSLLMLMTNGRILQHREACDFIARGEQPPDRQIETLLTITADAMSRGLSQHRSHP